MLSAVFETNWLMSPKHQSSTNTRIQQELVQKLIDTEKLFQQLAEKNWNDLSELLFKNKHLIHKNPFLGQVAQLFQTEFFNHIALLTPNDKLAKMRHIGLIIESDANSFSKYFVEKFIDEKLQALKAAGDMSLASYASTHFYRPLAKQLLQELSKEAPEQLAQARHSSAKIDAPTRPKATAKTLKFFKSQQKKISSMRYEMHFQTTFHTPMLRWVVL